MLIQRVAISEFGKGSGPTAVRVHWAFKDFIDTHVMIDITDDARARATEAGRAQ